LFLKPNESHTVSIAFFRPPGMLWLYSGVTMTKASADLIFWFHALHQRLGVGGVVDVADRAGVLAEDRQRPVPQVDDLGVEGPRARRSSR
jgi:hypothetical protein